VRPGVVEAVILSVDALGLRLRLGLDLAVLALEHQSRRRFARVRQQHGLRRHLAVFDQQPLLLALDEPLLGRR